MTERDFREPGYIIHSEEIMSKHGFEKPADYAELLAILESGLFYTAAGKASAAHEDAAAAIRSLIGERDEWRTACLGHGDNANAAERRAEAAEARAAEYEKALEDLVMACELPGDHCELQPSLKRAVAALARKGEG